MNNGLTPRRQGPTKMANNQARTVKLAQAYQLLQRTVKVAKLRHAVRLVKAAAFGTKVAGDPWPRGGIMNAGGQRTPPAVKPMAPTALRGNRVPMPQVASATAQKTPGLALGKATPLPTRSQTQVAKR